MPEEQSLKRSRSPSEAEPTANKRPNNKSSPKDDADDKSPASSRIASKTDDAQDGDKTSVAGDLTMENSASATTTAQDGKANPDLPAPVSSSSGSNAASTVPAAQIHLRCLIVTQDASIIIGKGGSHVNEIRDKSGARVMVSESIPGNPERILNVSGALDAVSKVIFISFVIFLVIKPYICRPLA